MSIRLSLKRSRLRLLTKRSICITWKFRNRHLIGFTTDFFLVHNLILILEAAPLALHRMTLVACQTLFLFSNLFMFQGIEQAFSPTALRKVNFWSSNCLILSLGEGLPSWWHIWLSTIWASDEHQLFLALTLLQGTSASLGTLGDHLRLFGPLILWCTFIVSIQCDLCRHLIAN